MDPTALVLFGQNVSGISILFLRIVPLKILKSYQNDFLKKIFQLKYLNIPDFWTISLEQVEYW
jgi:hypothetical protein